MSQEQLQERPYWSDFRESVQGPSSPQNLTSIDQQSNLPWARRKSECRQGVLCFEVRGRQEKAEARLERSAA